jgi:ABC-type phosphate transport system substrate-binding protein
MISHAGDAVFIAHPDVSTSSFSKEEVKNILLGNKTKWDGGGIIKLAVLSEGPTCDSVILTYTSRSADQFDKYWKKMLFTGKGMAPDAFKTDAEMIAFVAKTPGAFGYIAEGASPTGVKTINVQ